MPKMPREAAIEQAKKLIAEPDVSEAFFAVYEKENLPNVHELTSKFLRLLQEKLPEAYKIDSIAASQISLQMAILVDRKKYSKEK